MCTNAHILCILIDTCNVERQNCETEQLQCVMIADELQPATHLSLRKTLSVLTVSCTFSSAHIAQAFFHATSSEIATFFLTAG